MLKNIVKKSSTTNGSSCGLKREQSVSYPMPKDETLRLRKNHLGSPCALYFRDDPIKMVRGEGQYLYDDAGRQYLDCINNVAHVGHCHPHVTKVACNQMGQLYTNSRFLNDNLSNYVQRITQLFPEPLEVCFLCNSGSEANDLALTLAQTYTGGSDVITLDSAYHGHLQSLIHISPYKYLQDADKPEYVHIAPSPDTYRGMHANSSQSGSDYALEVQRLIEKIKQNNKQLSSFIMESLQSCGGQVIPPTGYMQEAFRHVREAGGVCIADEVQVGFGRVGNRFWAFELQEVVPDIVTIGKPMGNGHPVAGVVTTKKIADSLAKRIPSYFNTYAGNPVSCAIANAVLDVIEDEKLMQNALEVGAYTLKKLQILKDKYQFVGDLRGVGLFIGIDLVKNRQTREPYTDLAQEILQRLKDRFILMSIDGPYNNVLKFKPPMCFSKNNADHLTQTLDEIMATMPDTKKRVEGNSNGQIAH